MFHVKHFVPHILLINPWITDFAAYNLWVRPLGLISLASLLRVNGFNVSLIDCLDFNIKSKKYKDGKFFKTIIEKPFQLKSIPRNYSQYGIPEEILWKRLLQVDSPDLICITSGMTYWYPGVFKLIEITKKFFKKVPIILGGIYATLCFDHAKRHSGADIVFKGGNEFDAIKLISELTGYRFSTPNPKPQTDSHLAYDLYQNLEYVCVSTSRGCPYKCTYCATPILTKGFVRKEISSVINEIEYWITHYQVNNIAFYDDALLVDSSNYFIPIMDELNKREIHCNFHTPNAIHIREINEEVANVLYKSRFKTIRLGLETSNKDLQVKTGRKVNNHEFKQAVKFLKRAGYSSEEIGVYLMAGLPGQYVKDVEESIAFIKECGAKPILVEYSPIPQTPLFEEAKRMSSFDLENEPLFHNNSIIPCQWKGFTLEDYARLKEQLRRK